MRFKLPGLVGLLAAVALAIGVTTAQAAAPPDPHTVGSITLSNIALNGTAGTVAVVAPGANVSISAHWADHLPAGICTSICIVNFPVAFQGFGAQPAGCLANAVSQDTS